MTPTTLESEFSNVLGRSIDGIKKLSGGCSYPAFVVNSGNQRFFVKTNDKDSDVFLKESEGLLALEKWTSLVPELIHADKKILILEYIEPEAPTAKFWTNLGVELAQMHNASGPGFGFESDNFIGLSEQKNTSSNSLSWAEFFWQNRLLFKLNQLKQQGRLSESETRIEDLKSATIELLKDHNPKASPVHGDLWNGNIICGPNQKPAIVDPAFYYGDCETDLAMTECFGGFDSHFYESYQAESSLDSNYQTRKHLYNLYHMLNHQVIFGSQYRAPVSSIIDQLIS